MEHNEIIKKIEKLEEEVAELQKKRAGVLKGYLARAFRKTAVVTGVCIAAFLTGFILYAAQITFTNGTVISATDVNANFTELYTNVTQLFTKTKRLEATYRWAVWSTYNQSGPGWIANDNASLFGGVAPSVWGDGRGIAVNMSSNKEVLRTLFTQKGYAGKNAMVYADTWYPYGTTNSKHVGVLFRIRNTTATTISWMPYCQFQACESNGNRFSWNLNGNTTYSGNSDYDCSGSCQYSFELPIPPSRTSTIIVISTNTCPNQTVTTFMAFINNSLQLPSGLEFVDDLDIATGGWEQ